VDKISRAIWEAFSVVHEKFRLAVEGTPQDVLNYQPAPHKMSVGQIALHTAGAERYFMNPEPVFERTEWTYVPAEYPLVLDEVLKQIDLAAEDVRNTLESIRDEDLEKPWRYYGDRTIKLGYILMRLTHHEIYHMAQIAYLRSWLQKDWRFEGHWGQAATAIISLPYRTTQEL